MLLGLNESEVLEEFKRYYQQNADERFNIYSRRQDIGIAKCEFGWAEGFLEREEVTDWSGQSMRWVYTFNEKAKEMFS